MTLAVNRDTEPTGDRGMFPVLSRGHLFFISSCITVTKKVEIYIYCIMLLDNHRLMSCMQSR